MREGSAVFVDTGAWIALALSQDPFHERARESWEELLAAGSRLFTSVPVVLETFTFLDRNTVRDVAITWKDSLAKVPRLRIWNAPFPTCSVRSDISSDATFTSFRPSTLRPSS